MTKFPEFFAGIQRKPQGNQYDAEDFYPAEIAGEKIKEIAAWLKSIESKNFEKVPLDAEQLDSDAVMAIERAADAALAATGAAEPSDFKKLKGVPRNALMKPSDAEHRLGDQRFALGDRVVYVQDSGRVPIATRGTVVGISRTARAILLDVVFDVTFMSGTTLGERCTPFRGSTIPITSVLNLTNKQLIAGSKAGAEKHPAPVSTPLAANGGYGMPTGPGGRGQLRESNAPAPLRSSFRGAVAGHNGFRGNGVSRGRGRGGLGYSDQNASPAMHSSNMAIRGNLQNGMNGGRGGVGGGFRGGRGGGPVGYNAVPPPSSLEARGRGRGRGGGRARGPLRGRGSAVQPVQAQQI
ncbi:5'-3' exoribonuclease [Lachnellula subtilissima]|uniref:5'-3' exoribonuclease n=1 Tax=Lachnellula subtilissima TaxID=602034 RepID=A0A8H8RSE2_9HELO|nr:5'-3' exoribonuclease [Lachnellula subtilissima]